MCYKQTNTNDTWYSDEKMTDVRFIVGGVRLR